eukprot:6189452-Pleurochrysis_carterae.AAC.3
MDKFRFWRDNLYMTFVCVCSHAWSCASGRTPADKIGQFSIKIGIFALGSVWIVGRSVDSAFERS